MKSQQSYTTSSVPRSWWRHGRHAMVVDRAEPTAAPQPVSDPQHAHRSASTWATCPGADDTTIHTSKAVTSIKLCNRGRAYHTTARLGPSLLLKVIASLNLALRPKSKSSLKPGFRPNIEYHWHRQTYFTLFSD